MQEFYPTAVPLVAVDPFFSIWSFSERLYEDVPRHWTGRKNAMTGLLCVDGVWHRFLGKIEQNQEEYFAEPPVMVQKSMEILPTRTLYRFENRAVELQLEFLSPLLTDDWDLMSRPVSYISYQVKSKDDRPHDVCIYLDIGSEASVNDTSERVSFSHASHSIRCGRGEKGVLSESGDDLRIDWGWLHFAAPGHVPVIWDTAQKKKLLGEESRLRQMSPEDLDNGMSRLNGEEYAVCDGYPSIGGYRRGTVGNGALFSGTVCVAYDDIHSVSYLGKPVDAYWRKDGISFDDMLAQAIRDHDEISARAARFDRQLQADAERYGSEYSRLLCLAYRQVMAAHKLTFSDGEIQFFSKECFSNGCICTVDVTYPSIPLFLKYCPRLIEGMLNPIFRFAASEKWEFPFAPHDMGRYPIADGQAYSLHGDSPEASLKEQMPIEECGNMILCVAALSKWENDFSYANGHRGMLEQWAQYLKQVGWDPSDQLCTDDFTGHMAHNCNLSVKAILALAAWGKLLEKMGSPAEADAYRNTALAWAREWEKAAFAGDHYKLSFQGDRETWSLKYNLVWDRLLDLDVFDPKVAQTEIAYYKKKMHPYGVPLDSRSDYTKSDWQMWTTMLTDDAAYRNAVVQAMTHALRDMDQRVPFPDWYFTTKAKKCLFQNRTVQGGLYICMLEANRTRSERINGKEGSGILS